VSSTTLLLADDSLTIHKLVALSFVDEGITLETAISGDAALQKARSVHPDVVLADVFMPGMSGYELCESIKNDPELASVAVLLLVGTFEPFDQTEAARVRSDGHVTKPFDSAELVGKVRDLIRSRRAAAPTESRAAELCSARTRESFLGSTSILDLFGPGSEVPSPEAAPPAALDERAIEAVVESVVRRVAEEIVRNLAREIVPQVAEAWVKSNAAER
jgi:CheY-like chemotaxis protein